jgi:hypothetical protein
MTLKLLKIKDPKQADEQRVLLEKSELLPIQQEIDRYLSEQKDQALKEFQPQIPLSTASQERPMQKEESLSAIKEPQEALDASQIPEELTFQAKQKVIPQSLPKKEVKKKSGYSVEDVEPASEEEQRYQKKNRNTP